MPGGSKIAAYLATPQGKRAALYTGIGATALVAGGLIWFGATSPARKGKKGSSSGKRGAPTIRPSVPRGRLFCPSEEGKTPVSSNAVRVGDFVILKIVSHDLTYGQGVWGRVLSVSPDKEQVYVELTTSLTTAGMSPVHTEKHGFHLGEKLKIGTDCIYEVLHRGNEDQYQIICGVLLADLGYQIPKKALQVKRGDFVWIVVGNKPTTAKALPGKTWNEKVRVSVTSLGKIGSVLHGLVWDDPENTEQHGLRKYSKVEFTHDCIVEV